MNYKNRSRSVSLIVAVSLLLISLAFAQPIIPSESDAKRVFNNGTKGMFRIISFEKSDGLSGEVYGVKVYVIEYKAEIEQLENLSEVSISSLNFFEQHLEKDMISIDGETIKLNGVLEFIKTEKGWKGEDGNVY